MPLELTKCEDGAISVSEGSTILSPLQLYIRIHDMLGIVQIGNGLYWTPWNKLDNVGDVHIAQVGDYEITVKLAQPKGTSVTKNRIINLKEVRRFKRLAMKRIRGEGK